MTIAGRIKHLEKEHAELDKKIDGMERNGVFSDEHLVKLKKQRLHIRDDIAKLKEHLKFEESKQAKFL
jgi:hypothetical protein